MKTRCSYVSAYFYGYLMFLLFGGAFFVRLRLFWVQWLVLLFGALSYVALLCDDFFPDFLLLKLKN